jgi:hypothetical protein
MPHKTLPFKDPCVFTPKDIDHLYQSCHFVIQSHACLYRKQALIELGGFHPKLHSLCDWYLNLALALKHGFAYTPEYVSRYRLHPQSYARRIQQDRWKRQESLHTLIDLLSNAPKLDHLFTQYKVFSQLPYPYFIDLCKRPSLWRRMAPSVFKKIASILRKRIDLYQRWVYTQMNSKTNF